jgi:hypothetical protein
LQSIKRFIGRSLAVLLVAGVVVPMSGNAWMLHSHAATAQAQKTPDTRLFVQVHNAGLVMEDVKVGGRVYTMHSDGWLQIKAPAGTPVYAASEVFGRRKGDLLFAVTPKVNNKTVTLY